MSAETRIDRGIEKAVPGFYGSSHTLELTAQGEHGRVYLRRRVSKRNGVTTDALTNAEAKHYARCIWEAACRSEAEQAGAA